jgi:hypothetical protein
MGHWNYHVRRIMLYILLYHLCYLAHPSPATPSVPQGSPPNSPTASSSVSLMVGVHPPLKSAPSASPSAPLLPADAIESKSDGGPTPNDAPVVEPLQIQDSDNDSNGNAKKSSCWSCFSCCWKSSSNDSSVNDNGNGGGNTNGGGRVGRGSTRGSNSGRGNASSMANGNGNKAIQLRIPVNDQGNRTTDHMVVVMQLDQPLHERVTRCVEDFKAGRIPPHLAIYCGKTVKVLYPTLPSPDGFLRYN